MPFWGARFSTDWVHSIRRIRSNSPVTVCAHRIAYEHEGMQRDWPVAVPRSRSPDGLCFRRFRGGLCDTCSESFCNTSRCFAPPNHRAHSRVLDAGKPVATVGDAVTYLQFPAPDPSCKATRASHTSSRRI